MMFCDFASLILAVGSTGKSFALGPTSGCAASNAITEFFYHEARLSAV